MPTFTKITFDNTINSSLQIGDAIYVSNVDASSGITSEPVYAQKVREIASGYIVIDKDTTVDPVITPGQFILFAKDIRVNESSLKGYYADVTFQNSSNKKVELFAVSSEIALSSK